MPAPITPEQREHDRRTLLDTAESLMYAKGIQAVGMDEVRETTGLPLNRIYALYPSKEELVVDMLRRRDIRWRGQLAGHVERIADPAERVLSIFDWLHEWFSEPGFRGCAWINAFGELGSSSESIRAAVRAHQAGFRDQVAAWVGATRPEAADGVFLLAEGAMVTAGVTGDPGAATQARRAARRLLGLT